MSPLQPRRLTLLLRYLLLAACAVLLPVTIGLQTHGVFDLPRDEPSETSGSSAAGSLSHGRRLPCRGENFASYSWPACLLGRNSVHSELREIIIGAYRDLAAERPEVRFVYGEMAWPRGGNFWPHKTHQNGLCADFFVPVLQDGRSIPLPVSPWNKFGYGLEFDSAGRLESMVIDYESMGAHILALNRHASRRGFAIAFVILDNPLQVQLAKTPSGRLAMATVRFSRLPSWVRHDEHYHIEFVKLPGAPTSIPSK